MSNEESNKVALYKQIKDDLKKQILAQKFAVGDKVPTESELMAQFDVSRMTAKRALDELVEDGLIERHPGKGSFVIDHTLATRNSEEPLTIGLIVPRPAPSFGPTMISTIAQLCQDQNINLLYVETKHNTVEEEAKAIKRLRPVAQGLIIWPVPGRVIGTEILKLIVENYPVVLLDRYIQDMNASSIVTNNKHAVQDAFAHFYQLGHRHVCLVPKENLTDVSIQDRVAFAQSDWAKYDNTSMSLIHTRGIHYHDPEEAGKEKQRLKQRLQALLTAEPDITAFFVTEYHPATILYDALHELGYRVPQDFSIICYDFPVFYTEHVVAFTHIQQDELAFARDAVTMLVGLIDGVAKQDQILEPSKLIIGETTGPMTNR